MRGVVLGLWMYLLSPGVSAATVQAEVGIGVSDAPTIWVGQRVIVNLDLWSTGFTFSDQRIHLPEVVGGLLMKTDSATGKLSETRSGKTWQGLRYDLSLFPQRPGTLSIPPIDVSFQVSAGYGQSSTAFGLRTDPLTLEVVLPPGFIDPNGVITSNDLTVTETWDPDVDSIRVGDALTRMVTRRAEDVSAVLFPPLPTPAIDGLASYPKAPQVTDQTERGRLVGERTESVTFVAQREGPITIPEWRVRWWNPDTETLEEKAFEARTFDVMPNPALGESAASGSFRAYLGRLPVASVIALTLLLAGGALLLFRHRLIRQLQVWRAQRAVSEPARFRQVTRACNEGEAATAYNALVAWMTCLDALSLPVTLAALVKRFPDARLTTAADGLQRALLDPGQVWDGRAMATALRGVRKRALTSTVGTAQRALPPLNPGPPASHRADA